MRISNLKISHPGQDRIVFCTDTLAKLRLKLWHGEEKSAACLAGARGRPPRLVFPEQKETANETLVRL